MKNKDRIANLEKQIITLQQQIIAMQVRVGALECKPEPLRKYTPEFAPRVWPDTSAPTWKPGDIIC